MATTLQLVMEANNKLLTSAKVMNPRGCSIDIDKCIQRPVLIMKGKPSQTRVQIPREDRPFSSLRLHSSLLVAQICLDSMDHFAVEVVVSQYTVNQTKLIIGTYVKNARYDETAGELTTGYLPLIIPRNKWVQVVFHIAGITQSVFHLPSITTIDRVTLTGTGKMSRVFTSSDERSCIDSTPEGMALFAVPAYAPPIWKTAVPSRELQSSSLTLDTRPGTSSAGDLPLGTTIPSRTESPPSVTSSSPKHSVMPPRLQPLESTLMSPSYYLMPSSRTTSELVGVPSRNGSSRLPSKCDYIRLVDDDDTVSKDGLVTGSCFYGDGHRNQAFQEVGPSRSYGAGRGAANSAVGSLSGWEEPPEDRASAVVTASSARVGKVDTVKRPPQKLKSRPAPPGSSDKERLQRIIASRKLRVTPGSGLLSGTGGDGRSNSSRRQQQRLRRRMRVLRANEQKVNKAAAAKTLVASKVPLSQRVEVAEDSAEAAPVCGYGFGYLGVLKPNGEYEEDESANLNLEGALTLLTDSE
ncbi:hypothetical protein JKF63_06061 [Porcisia hertigi]|uniref:CFA20 domain-containing protein n=1 Tax=Porcisia hertigi TaxID=2761500 RepID=A0A836IZ36_9TRYP|nr:hypothetical protein JKF63_06061 [Porcisia hertigi]